MAKKKGGDENLTLFGQRNKNKGKGPSQGKGKSEGSTLQPLIKDLSEINRFICHVHSDYASQCPNKKGKGKSQQKPLQKLK